MDVMIFMALLFMARQSLTQTTIENSNICEKETTITENDKDAFTSARTGYQEAIVTRPDLAGLVENVTADEIIPYQLGNYFFDICPSVTTSAIFWGIPYQPEYKCWIIQSVSFTRCSTYDCQNWSGVPWIKDYVFLCKEKYVYEYVWSYCVKDVSEVGFFRLIKVKIPKSCVCTLALC
ncbi:hypothetical protein CHS0354_029795 [Potamilus streckersoni]|uniref:Uncharacterized protein n=1 Tax=Potamilus streckersoni TaxID=2493646 RepID=A0AAE0TH67_9BIVA|nr:hypothetical protein CHS0354_029795 [Potamilus streckersoni]